MKLCSSCKIEKPNIAFYKAAKNKDGFQYSCKECQHKSQRDRKKYRADWMAEYRNKIDKYVRSLKEGKPCQDCKQNYPPHILQFDHRSGVNKKFCLSEVRSKVSNFELIKAEADKCDIVCANCHCDRTLRRSLGEII